MNGEDADIIGVLVGSVEPLVVWMNDEVTREISLDSVVGLYFKLAIDRVDGKVGDGIVAPVRDIELGSGGIQVDVGDVIVYGDARRKCCVLSDDFQLVAIIDAQGGDRIIEFVGEESQLAIGVENEVAGSAAGG